MAKRGHIDTAVNEFLRNYCVAVLRLYHGNVAKAAKHAGRDRPSFYRMLWRIGVLKKR
jgi:hypothetical protein